MSPLKSLDRLSLAARVWLVIAIVVVGLVALTVMSAMDSRSLQMEARKRALGDEVSTAMTLVQSYHDRAEKGEFSDAEAQKRALAAVSTLRWNDGAGYVYIFDSSLAMRMHPVMPKRVGKSIKDESDSTGKYMYREMLAADRRDGHGITEYMWPMPGSKGDKLKMTYTAWYKPWDLHIAAGAYFVDIDAQFMHMLVGSLLRATLVGLLVILVVWQSMRSIRLSIGGEPAFAVAMAARIADGDLTVADVDAAPAPGSLLDALQRMRSKLTGIVGKVQQGAHAVTSAAQQIASGNDDLSHRTQEQASSLEETAASMEEMTSTVKQSADNAQQASRLAADMRVQAEHGGDVASRASGAMKAIQQASAQISDIVSLIDEIAFQTNLLALNAAVEAAHAGQHGHGFAVVAGEVRSLAQRSARAAKDIKGLIGDSVEKVQAGSQLVDESGRALAGIIGSAKKVADIVDEIAAASQEQSTGIEQVNRAVTQMDEVTQQNAALVEEAAAAARAMQEQADQLQAQMRYFRLQEAKAVEAAPLVRQGAVRKPAAPARPQDPAGRELAVAGEWAEF
ncbi:chemotaxis protein [Dyella psychrodurans]|uniref:Chemotaxis protein n=2 Tax=Dyella psychrodurans TaxID=1927960 RepID=A0A370X192_9GAMM|nr:chemotaxis protein [Dyella psychrodurans]